MAGHGGRRKRHEEHEEHENHERWLVTYADMVTLLMVLFIVMFAMSQVDERKYAELKEGLAAGFGSHESILDGSTSIQSQSGSAAVEAVAPNLAAGDLPPAQQAVLADAVQQAEALERQRAWADAEAEAERLEEVRRRLMEALERQGLRGDVTTTYDHRGLVVSLVSRHVVFEADLAVLSVRGQQVVDAVAPVLRRLEDPLQVDGHTNQVPVRPKYFATDWDLSSARAVTVLRRLEERHGLPAARLSVAGYGHTRPLVDPSEPGSQAVNKRVDIVVLSQLPPEEAALLPQVTGSGRDRPGARGGADEAPDADHAGAGAHALATPLTPSDHPGDHPTDHPTDPPTRQEER